MDSIFKLVNAKCVLSTVMNVTMDTHALNLLKKMSIMLLLSEMENNSALQSAHLVAPNANLPLLSVSSVNTHTTMLEMEFAINAILPQTVKLARVPTHPSVCHACTPISSQQGKLHVLTVLILVRCVITL